MPGAPGDFHGRPTRRLENGHCWVEVLAEAGPRIVRFGLAGEESILAETPQASWDGGYGPFELLGGHRALVRARERRVQHPGHDGIAPVGDPDAGGPGVRLVGAIEAQIGLRKTIEVRLDPGSAAMSLRHILANVGTRRSSCRPGR